MILVPYQNSGIVYFKVRLVPLYVVVHTSERNKGIMHLESASFKFSYARILYLTCEVMKANHKIIKPHSK